MENFKNVFNNLSIPIMVVNKECDLIAINKNMFSLCNTHEIELNSTKCYELFHNTDNLCRTGSQTCPVEKVFTAGESHRTILKHSTTKGEIIHEVLATPIFDEHGKIEYAIAEYHSGIQEFRGLISMCSSCKKIRLENGEWVPVEEYIRYHSMRVEISHGYCNCCIKDLKSRPKN